MATKLGHYTSCAIAIGCVWVAANSARADSISTMPNPFALSRLNANLESAPLALSDEKMDYEGRDGAGDGPSSGFDDGQMANNFVYYSSLTILPATPGGGGGFGGGGFVGGGGGGGFGAPIPYVDYFPDETGQSSHNTTQPVPAPGAALLGLIGLGMVRRFRRRFA